MSSAKDTSESIEVFVAYAREDKALLEDLKKWLESWDNKIAVWYDVEITPGKEWVQEIDTHLNAAPVILLLISVDFLNSPHCKDEMERAIRRHRMGEACVIPIILRLCPWQNMPISALEVLPTGGQPISKWTDREEALYDVARRFHKMVEEFLSREEPLVMAATVQSADNTQSRKVNKKALFRGCLLVSIPLLILFCVVPVLWFWNSWNISKGDIVTKLTAIGVILMTFAILIALLVGFAQVFIGILQLQSVRIETVAQKFELIYDWTRLKINRILYKRFSRKKRFCISYRFFDRYWANWISWKLELAGYSTTLSEWNDRNFIEEKHFIIPKARYTISLISPDYLNALEDRCLQAFEIWNSQGQNGIPVVVQECNFDRRLHGVAAIDLRVENQETATRRILENLPISSDPHYKAIPFQEIPPFPGVFPTIFGVSNGRNGLFIGREKFLAKLRQSFVSGVTKQSVIQVAIVGLSGLGKTRVAKEYTHRYGRYYRYIFWVDTSLQSTSEAICKNILSYLQEVKNVPDGTKEGVEAINEVKGWLGENPDWLIVLDKCSDLTVVEEFVPTQSIDHRGHILITTRIGSVLPTIIPLRLEPLEKEEGALFLLSRITSDRTESANDKFQVQNLEIALEISSAMGGLPLGIEHAGAYIVSKKSDLSKYLNLFKTRHAEILSVRNDHVSLEFQTIATTWSLSFDEIKNEMQSAGELLQFCAFLASNPIPEEIIAQAPMLPTALKQIVGDPIAFDRAIEILRKYSLIDRSGGFLFVHPLVQAVIREGIYDERGVDNGMQLLCAKRAVKAVDKIFPEVRFEYWSDCERFLPHALMCLEYVQKWSDESWDWHIERLLYRTSCYLQEQARYAEAERCLTRVSELLTSEALLVLFIPLNNIGMLNYVQGKLSSLIRYTAIVLNNLGMVSHGQGRYPQAKTFYDEALEIYQNDLHLGQGRLDVVPLLNNLGRLYYDCGNFPKAEQLFEEAFQTCQQFGLNDPQLAITLNNLAGIYYKRGEEHRIKGENGQARDEYNKAKSLYEISLNICKEQLGKNHPETASAYATLASTYLALSDFPDDPEQRLQAELFYRRAIEISEQAFGLDHPQVANKYHNLGELYRREAERTRWTERLRRRKAYKLAEQNYQKALSIYEHKLGEEHPYIESILKNYAFLMDGKVNRYSLNAVDKELYIRRARKMRRRAAQIEKKYEKEKKLFFPSN